MSIRCPEGGHLSGAKSFPEEERQSRRGPRQQTQAGQQKTRTGQPQRLRTRWQPLRMAEDRNRCQTPKDWRRRLGEHLGGSQMA